MRYPRQGSRERGYGAAWRRARLHYLRAHPLCAICYSRGTDTRATVVDHVRPHRGDMVLFWDVRNWQPLCKSCHDMDKQRIETGGRARTVPHDDGWPR